MPRIDELPPAQNEIRGRRKELGNDYPEKRRMTLMRRLASVGLGLRAEEGRRADVRGPSTHPSAYSGTSSDIPALLRRRSSWTATIELPLDPKANDIGEQNGRQRALRSGGGPRLSTRLRYEIRYQAAICRALSPSQ
jgi:hypothetical protein